MKIDKQATTTLHLGFVILAVSLLAMYSSGNIAARGLGSNNDPGPKLFPQTLSLILLVWGGAEMVRALLVRRGRRIAGQRDRSHRWTRQQRLRFAIFTALLLGYVPAVGYLGFTISSTAFISVAAFWLGAKWYVALPFGVLLTALVHLLFVQLFRVQLPSGDLGMWF